MKIRDIERLLKSKLTPEEYAPIGRQLTIVRRNRAIRREFFSMAGVVPYDERMNSLGRRYGLSPAAIDSIVYVRSRSRKTAA